MRKEEGTSLDNDMMRGKERVAKGGVREGKVKNLSLITSIDKSEEIRRRK